MSPVGRRGTRRAQAWEGGGGVASQRRKRQARAIQSTGTAANPVSPILVRAPNGENREDRDFRLQKEVDSPERTAFQKEEKKSPGLHWDIGENGAAPGFPPDLQSG